jgi:hypothetical protein
MVQVPNLALTDTKLITVQCNSIVYLISNKIVCGPIMVKDPVKTLS